MELFKVSVSHENKTLTFEIFGKKLVTIHLGMLLRVPSDNFLPLQSQVVNVTYCKTKLQQF